MEKETNAEVANDKNEKDHSEGGGKKEVSKKVEKSINPFFLKGSLLGILVVIILFIVTFGIGIYRYQWNNSVVAGVVKIVPFPVVMVDGNFVTYNEFLEDIRALRQYTDRQGAIGGESIVISDDELKQVVISQFISRELIENALADYGIKISDQDIEAEYVTVLGEQGGDEEELKTQLKDVYGWNLDQFKEKIIKFGLMEQRLAEKVAFDNELEFNKKQRARIDGLLTRIRNGESFEEIARTENDDEVSAAQGGDIGFVQRGMLVKEFEDMAFAMKPGEVSDVIQTGFGYHLIKFEERKEATENSPEEIRVRNILMRTANVQDYLIDAKENSKVRKFIDTSEWPEI